MSTYLVSCRACGASNRVPADKEGVPGHCGSCHARLPALYWRPRQLSDQSLDPFVAGYDGPVIAEFWAPW